MKGARPPQSDATASTKALWPAAGPIRRASMPWQVWGAASLASSSTVPKVARGRTASAWRFDGHEIFSFVIFRPPRLADLSAGANGIALERARDATPLIDDLVTLKNNGQPRRQFETRARRYVTSDDYALGPVALPLDVAAFAARVDAQGARVSSAAVREWVRGTCGQSVQSSWREKPTPVTRRRGSAARHRRSCACTTQEDSRWPSRP
jgi:hypothetical protein